MGWYKTCTICNKSAKYGLDCDCYVKASDAVVVRITGHRLIEQKLVFTLFGNYSYQRFDNICLSICLTEGEYSRDQKVVEISEEQYFKGECEEYE